MVGPALFLTDRRNDSREANQRRRGAFKRSAPESPGEEPLFEIRNAIKTEASEIDGEFKVVESE